MSKSQDADKRNIFSVKQANKELRTGTICENFSHLHDLVKDSATVEGEQ